MAQFDDLVASLYQEQLGRAPDPEGGAYWAGVLAGGADPAAVAAEMARSLEGQQFLTQAITSEYRQELGRNPEDEGFQYWLSSALNEGMSANEIRNAIEAAAVREQTERGITSDFTEMVLEAINADPYAGRLPTRSIYDIPTNEADRVNISYINGVPVQFVSPLTSRPVTTTFGGGQFAATAGEDVLSNPVVVETMNRQLEAGALTQKTYTDIVKGLANAKSMDDVRQVFSTPKANVIIDAIWGLQTGEDVDLAKARLEAKDRQAVIDSMALNYYPSNWAMADAYEKAGLEYPFGKEAYNYNTMMTRQNVVTPQNFQQRINQLIQDIGKGSTLTGRFGGFNDLQTPLTGQYYSETGLQPGFTPFGTEGTTFRSGVAGYMPQADLPTGFQFGAPPVNATFQQYRPGAFQPEGVTTGGFITGYTQAGAPIYSTYANPNVNVGGTNSQLIPFANQAGMLADLQNQLAALQANPVLAPQMPQG